MIDQMPTTRRSVHCLLAEARTLIPQLTPKQALLVTLGVDTTRAALLIDIRTPTERQIEGVIPGSLHIPRTLLEWCCDPGSAYRNPAICNPHQQLIIVCSEGYSSNLAAMTLYHLGCANVANLEGGYRGWKASHLPTKAPDRRPDEELAGMNPPESLDGVVLPMMCKRVPLRYWFYRAFLWMFQ